LEGFETFDESTIASVKYTPTPLAYKVSTELHVWLADFEGAITEANRAVSLDSNDPDSHYAMGQALIAAGEHREAAHSFKRAMRLDPFYQDTLGYGLGIAYFYMKQFEKAASLFERAHKSSPQDEGPLWLLTAAYEHLGREKEAKTALAKLRELNPMPLRHLARGWRKHKDPEDFNLVADGLRKAGME
jgi:adenylate cyclase